jgi:hypothetical protein
MTPPPPISWQCAGADFFAYSMKQAGQRGLLILEHNQYLLGLLMQGL